MSCSVILVRITSTHVENTFFTTKKERSNKDHLHTRGEYTARKIPPIKSSGSPPHTWRIRYACRPRIMCHRITSTHVENTILLINSNFKFWDHLHTRGEYDLSVSSHYLLLGSPPHTWRIPQKTQHPVIIHRITSTHVENTFWL